MTRKSTLHQDGMVLLLRRRGLKQYAIAYRLSLTIHQVRHSERRIRARGIEIATYFPGKIKAQ